MDKVENQNIELKSALQEKILDLRTVITVEYNIPSSLGDNEERRYCQRVYGEIFLTDEITQEAKLIGNLEGMKILLSKVIEEKQSIFDTFDLQEDTMYFGEKFWDFENNKVRDEILEYVLDEFQDDILIINSLSLNEDLRGLGLGRYIIKDYYNNFSSGCGIFIAELDPENILPGKKHKLTAYLNLLGFVVEPRVGNDIMFLNPNSVNGLKDINFSVYSNLI